MKKERLIRLFDAFGRYKERLNGDEDHRRDTASAAPAILSGSVTEQTRKTVKIHPDWVEAIEEGLPCFFRAIAEDRQFIQRDGRVVPVERARRVTRESAEHLARHGELLRDQGDGDLRPGKIYVKENRSNYAIYENRFLYTALCFLRDFVDARYRAILGADRFRQSGLSVDAQFESGGRKYAYRLRLTEEDRDSDGTASHEHRALLERIGQLRFSVSQLLATPLMTEMAKEPPVQPPITVTNILKADANYRSVFRLYSFLSSYSGDGFTLTEEKTPPAPLSKAFSEDLAQTLLLESFFLNCYTRGLSDGCAEGAAALRLSEKAAAAEEAARFARQMRENHPGDVQGYAAHLEEALLRQNDAALFAREVALRQETSAGKIFALTAQAEELSRRLSESEAKRIAAEKEAYIRLERERALLNQAAQERIQECLSRQEALASQAEALTAALSNAEGQLADCREENHLLHARLLAARRLQGEPETVDYTEKAHFDALEREKAAFDRFFDETWTAAKKRIVKSCIKGRK